jgi:hypothetical protein
VARSELVVSVRLLIALVALAGCNGKLIHLGDGRCVRGEVQASEVLWTGDSWILMPGTLIPQVRDAARRANAIGPNDDYVVAAAAAADMAAVAAQYDARQAGAIKVKVLIMDGGTWDTLVSNGSAASVDSVVNTFGQHLDKVASDGTVEDIVYILPPELPGIPGVAALRAPMRQLCADSAVPCRFVDAQTVWAGHPEYTAAGGVFPNEQGATALAGEIWAVMQRYCIAQ